MIRKLVATFLIVYVIAVTIGHAQPPPGFRGRGGFGRSVLWRLLDLQSVREELRIEKQQQELLEDLQADLSEQRRGVFSRPGESGGDDEPRGMRSDRFRREMVRRMQAVTRQGEELVAVVLEPEQVSRLNQIRLQSEGTWALERPEFLISLSVSDEQLEKIREIRRVDVGSRGGDRRRNWPTREQLEKTNADILALLDEKQLEKWESMKGKEFDFPSGFSLWGRRSRGSDRD